MKKIALLFVAGFCYVSCVFAQRPASLVIDKVSPSGLLTLVTSYVECKATPEDEPNLFIGFSLVRSQRVSSKLFINIQYQKTISDAAILPEGRCLITKLSGKTIVLEQLPNSIGESDEFFDEDGKLTSWMFASYICRDMYGLFDGIDPAMSLCFGALPHTYKVEYTDELNPLNMAINLAIDPVIKGLQKRNMYFAEEWMEFN